MRPAEAKQTLDSATMCETEDFSVDKTWLSWLAQQPLATEPKIPLDLSEKLAAHEVAWEPQHGNSSERAFGMTLALRDLGKDSAPVLVVGLFLASVSDQMSGESSNSEATP